MKLLIKIICLTLACLTVLPLLLACDSGAGNTNDTTPSDDVSGETTPVGSQSSALDIFINGSTDFVVVRTDSQKATSEIRSCTDFTKAFRDATGKSIKIVTDWDRNPVQDLEICIGNVTRNGKYYDIAEGSIAQDEFIVKVFGTRLVLLGGTEYGTQKAVEWFIANYLNATDASVSAVSVPTDLDVKEKFELPTSIRIMTQNLLATDTEYEDNVKDPYWGSLIKVDLTQHTLAVRQPRMLEFFKTYAPDAIGVQECSDPWRKYFDKNLSQIGYRRIGASKNQKIGIIYNSNTLKLISHNSFWLTENPEKLKLSKEWGSASDDLIERLGMYVVFEVIATNERFIMFNTHVETPKNATIQTKQTEVLLNYIEQLQAKYPGLPVVMTGDFNYDLSTKAYQTLVSTTLVDTKKACDVSEGSGSFNKFIGSNYANAPIDQIIASKDGWIFSKYKVLYDTVDGCFLSDHYAVIADLKIEK